MIWKNFMGRAREHGTRSWVSFDFEISESSESENARIKSPGISILRTLLEDETIVHRTRHSLHSLVLPHLDNLNTSVLA